MARLGLTAEEENKVAEMVEADVRASMSVAIHEVAGDQVKINALTMFRILGMVISRLADSVQSRFPEKRE